MRLLNLLMGMNWGLSNGWGNNFFKLPPQSIKLSLVKYILFKLYLINNIRSNSGTRLFSIQSKTEIK